jgi:hypothetical protein
MRTILSLVVSVLVLAPALSGCAFINGARALIVVNETLNAPVSAENELFEKDSGVLMLYARRGLYIASTLPEKPAVLDYYRKSLDNKIVYYLNPAQTEFAQWVIADDIITISFSPEIMQYDDNERLILVSGTSAVFALLNAKNNKRNVKNMFFSHIDDFGENIADTGALKTSQWYKTKQVTFAKDSIHLN